MALMKTINYRGGIVRFDIPANWAEEYEPSGGGTFYGPGQDSGTLRLNVMTLSSNGSQPAAEMIASLIARSGYQPLGATMAIKESVKAATENGEALLQTYWEVGTPVPPDEVRVAVFSYTILESQRDDPAIQAEIALLGRSIRAAEYAYERGDVGDHHAPSVPPAPPSKPAERPKGRFGFLRGRSN